MKTGRKSLSFILLIIILITLSAVALFHDSFSAMISGNLNDLELITLYEIRIPRLLAALLSGMALSVSGMQMQSIFRNPLAGPYVLGISSGGALGVSLITMGLALTGIRFSSTAAFSTVVFASAAGCLVFLLIVFAIHIKLRHPATVLVAGILLGSAASAIVEIMQYLSPERSVKSFLVWTMGSLSSVDNSQIWIFMIFVSAGLILSLFLNNVLNVLRAGDEYAQILGIRVSFARILVFTSTGILTGSVVAFCGPIAFVGIAVPHMTRMILKTYNHRLLFPGNILTGSIVLLLADLGARFTIPGLQLPVNAMTSLIGIPVILYLILGKNKILLS